MRAIWNGLAAGVLVMALASCGALRKWFPQDAEEAEQPAPEEAATRVVGEVVAVYPDKGFVLIRRYGGGELPSGYVYNSVGVEGRTAALKPSGQRSGHFHAADVTGGDVERGDTVLARRLPDGTDPEVTPVAEPREVPFGMEPGPGLHR